MLRRRTSTNLDEEWRFWLVSVRRLDEDDRGFVFDRDGADSNNVPREAAGLASHWMIPDEDPWGLVRGKRFGSVADLYLDRSARDRPCNGARAQHQGIGIMCPTLTVAQSAVAAKQFPGERRVVGATDKDSRRLRHLPDHWVRPGGVPRNWVWDRAASTDSADVSSVGLELDVSPPLPEVLIGAPAGRPDTPKHASRACGRAARPLAEVWPGARGRHGPVGNGSVVSSACPLYRAAPARGPGRG